MRSRRSRAHLGRDLAAVDGLVQGGQGLGTKERRCKELVLAGDLGLRGGQVEDGAGVDDELSHWLPQIGW